MMQAKLVTVEADKIDWHEFHCACVYWAFARELNEGESGISNKKGGRPR